MVRNASSQGAMSSATTAQTAQMFSHFHRVVYFVGAAKLPFTRPAINVINTPKLTSLTHCLQRGLAPGIDFPIGEVGLSHSLCSGLRRARQDCAKIVLDNLVPNVYPLSYPLAD